MADELNWSGAFYESLAGSIGRVTRGGPVGMAAGVIGEFSAAMQGMNIPWQGPRTAASLAAAVGGGFVLLNAGRGVVEAVNAAGQGDYGSALANAAIGVGWYAGGRFALGTLARQLPVEAGAMAAYEEAARANFAREDPARYQQIISRFKKEQDMAQAGENSAAMAYSDTTNPNTTQTVAAGAATTAAEVASKPHINPNTAQGTARDAAVMAQRMATARNDLRDAPGFIPKWRYTTIGDPSPGYVTGYYGGVNPKWRYRSGVYPWPRPAFSGSPIPPPEYVAGGKFPRMYATGGNPPRVYVGGGNFQRISTTGGNPAIANRRGFWGRFVGWFGRGRQTAPRTTGLAGGMRNLFSAGRRRLSSGWQSFENFAQMLYAATIRGRRF